MVFLRARTIVFGWPELDLTVSISSRSASEAGSEGEIKRVK